MRRVESEQLCLFDLGKDMKKVRQMAARFKELNRSRNTLSAYRSNWKAFEAWCISAGRKPLPCDGETLDLYIADRLGEGLAVTSAEQHVAAIAYRHREEKLAMPDRSPVRATMEGVRRDRKETPRKRHAITAQQMRKVCRVLEKDGSLGALRDRALLMLGYATALRRSNLVALDFSDLHYIKRKGFTVTVRSSKTDQHGLGQVIPVHRGVHPETCPVRALQDWIARRGEHDGPLFTGTRHPSSVLSSKRMDSETVNQIVKAAVRRIGLNAALYGGHSLRASFVTTSHLQGASTLAIMERTGHKSVAMVQAYLRNAEPFAGANPLGRAL